MKTDTTSIRSVGTLYFRFLLSAFSIAVPLFFSSPQIITGSIVNCLLVFASERLAKKETIGIAVLPSLGALLHGVLFGPITPFLLYFLPCIWLSNILFMRLYSLAAGKPGIFRIAMPAIAKYLFLQVFAHFYVTAGIVPHIFLSTMGYIQLITAILGGLCAYGLLSYERNNDTH